MRLFFFLHMYVELRERNGDAANIEYLLGSFGQIEEYGPIVGSFDPYAEFEDESAVSLLTETNERRMRGIVVDDEFVRVCKVKKGGLNDLDIRFVSNAEFKVYAADIVYAVVNDNGVCERTVRHGNDLIIGGVESGVEDADILNCAADTVGFDKITDAEGLEDKDHDAACEVGKAALKSKTDNETAGCDGCGDGGAFNAEVDGDKGDQKHVKKDLYDIHDERLGVCVKGGELFAALDELEYPFDENGTDEEHEKCAEDREAVRNSKITETFPKLGKEFFHFEIPLFL